MSPASRKQRPDPDLDDFDVEVVGILPEPRPPEDPAVAAARMLVARAASACGTTIGKAAADGSICLISAPIEWTPAVRDAWRTSARGDERYDDGGAGQRSWHDGRWVAWSPTEPPAKACDPSALADAVWRGRHILAVASEPAWLPADLVAAADHRLVLPPLTAADVVALARQLCGGPVTSPLVSDADAAALTPRVLRLARRPGQTADGYARKLGDILERDRAAQAKEFPASASPRTAPDLSRLPGMPEATRWGRDLERDLSAYRRGELPWAAIDKGVLLHGPPGTGKTSFARALASTCAVPLVIGSLAQWQAARSGYLGDLLKAMRATFDEARDVAPSILFVDEVDGFGSREAFSHSHRDYSTQVVNGFLELLDGVTAREGVVTVGACNHPHRLDPAIVRSGRLDRSIHIPLPDRTALGDILRVHLGADLADADLGGVALMALGGTGADCERYVRGARRRARQEARPLAVGDLVVEIGGADGRTAAERHVAAVHEAGHAVAVLALRPGALLSVSIRDTERSGGHVAAVPLGDYLSGAALRDQLVVLLSGRAAEQEIVGVPTSGAGGGPGSDIAKATMLASLAVTDLALDEDRSGLLWSGVPDGSSMAAWLTANPALAARVKEMLAEAYGRARKLVRARRGAVEAMAEVLEHRQVLDGEEAAAVAREAS